MSYSVIWVSWHFSLAVFTVSSCVSWLCWQELQVHIMQSLIDRITYSLALDRSMKCFKASLITVASDLEKPLQTFMLIFLFSFFTVGIQKSLAAETQNMKCKKNTSLRFGHSYSVQMSTDDSFWSLKSLKNPPLYWFWTYLTKDCIIKLSLLIFVWCSGAYWCLKGGT